MNVSRETSSWSGWPEEKILSFGAAELGLDLGPKRAARLLDFLAELRRWNKKINLIGPAAPSDEIVLHLLDSLSPLSFLRPGLPGRDSRTDPLKVLDLGSGGGLPGLVLKIARPAWEMTLAEAKAKKAAFLRHAIRALALEKAWVLEARLDEEAQGPPASFDLVTARGLGPLTRIIPLARPFLRPGGRLLAYKGPNAGPDLSAAAKDLAEAGLSLEREDRLRLPFLNRDRVLLLFQRV